MFRAPFHSTFYMAVGCLLGFGASCTPSAHYDVLPFHDDALVHASPTPFQHPTVAARKTGSRPSSTSNTRPKSTPSSSPGLTDGVIAAHADTNLRTPKSGQGYEPAYALAYIFDTLHFNHVRFDKEDELRIQDVYQALKKKGVVYSEGTPAAGDLVFFHNTYDANNDLRNNDWYTHIGIVMSVDGDGTIHFLSYRDKQVHNDQMHIGSPHQETSKGKRINSRLREPQSQDPSYTQYLAGELYASFAAVLGNAREAAVLEQWQPPKRR